VRPFGSGFRKTHSLSGFSHTVSVLDLADDRSSFGDPLSVNLNALGRFGPSQWVPLNARRAYNWLSELKKDWMSAVVFLLTESGQSGYGPTLVIRQRSVGNVPKIERAHRGAMGSGSYIRTSAKAGPALRLLERLRASPAS